MNGGGFQVGRGAPRRVADVAALAALVPTASMTAWVEDQQDLFVWDKTATDAAGDDVVLPTGWDAENPGRWIREVSPVARLNANGTILTLGTIADGQTVQRQGNVLVGVAMPGGAGGSGITPKDQHWTTDGVAQEWALSTPVPAGFEPSVRVTRGGLRLIRRAAVEDLTTVDTYAVVNNGASVRLGAVPPAGQVMSADWLIPS